MTDCIYYRAGYKYQLDRDYTLALPELPPLPVLLTQYIDLVDGVLTVRLPKATRHGTIPIAH